jgi:hypothetical protein
MRQQAKGLILGGDASDYALRTYGNGNVQYNNVFKQGGGDNSWQASSNALRSLNGQIAGRGYSRGRNRSMGLARQGGNFASILGQAAPPLALLAIQQSYRRRSGKATRRRGRRRGRGRGTRRYR